MSIVMVMAVAVLITLREIPPFVRRRQWKEVAVFGAVLLTALILALSQALDVPAPKMTKIITETLISVFGE